MLGSIRRDEDNNFKSDLNSCFTPKTFPLAKPLFFETLKPMLTGEAKT